MKSRLSLTLSLSVLMFAAFAALNPRGLNTARASSDKKDSITQGTLMAVGAGGEPTGPCPLKHTEVRAEISGFLSRVTVTQEFENPFEEKIEAVYTFPLPESAAVDDMTMTVGGRTIKGKIMRRQEARAAYDAAKTSGRVASLLDQERPNIFTQSVANITPGQQIKVVISYVEVLKYEEGSYEWSFPMVVGTRYMPKAQAAGAEGANGASSINPPKGQRPGHDISIEVTLDAGVPLNGLGSLTHEVEVLRPDDRRAVVRLKENATIPNKDFVLKYDVAGGRVEDAVLAHGSERGRFFTLILQPPERVTAAEVMPKELVFVLDTSGSMEGFPLEKARETMKLALNGLYPQDTFNIITFSGDTEILFQEPVPATPENLSKAKKFLSDRKGGGGTEMMQAIRAALEPSDSQSHVRIACFMTDGQVGNDFEILSEVQKHPNARVFAMGFGDSPNRYLLDKMAEYGMGEVEYVTKAAEGSEAARRFHRRVREPLLTDISVEYQGIDAQDVYPARIPDLFSAKPVVLTGRYTVGGKGVIRLKGRMSGRAVTRDVEVSLPSEEPGHDVLATLWARQRVDDLMGKYISEPQAGEASDRLRDAITQLGLDFRLMTQFTSFVAVEDAVTTDMSEPRRVEVPAAEPPPPAPGNTNVAGMAQAVVTMPGAVSSINSLGPGTASVTITSTASRMDVTSANLSTSVEVRAIDGLPLRGRSQQQLVTLAPGVVSSAAGPASGSYSVSVNGQRSVSNSFMIDGVDANVGVGQGGQPSGATSAGTTPGLTAAGGTNGLASVGATQEIVINTNSYSAEYGRAAGGLVNVISKSGTNEFHGSLFEFFGNDALDAGDWFANSRALARPARRLNDFGGTFGGPFRRDKTFFYGSYEGLRLRQPGVALTEVPGLGARTVAPASVRPFLNAFPLPNGAARSDGFAEFAAGFSNPARMDTASLRVDHWLSPNLMLSARYNFSASSASARGAGGSSLNTLNERDNLLQTLTASAAYTVSPTVVADVRANYSRLRAAGSFRLDGFGGAALPAGQDPLAALFPAPSGAARFDLDGQNSSLVSAAEVANTQRQFSTVGVVQMTRGKHSLKFGADYRRVSPVLGLQPYERSVLFNGVAQALAGVATRDGSYWRATPQRPVFQNLSLYGEDEWKMTERLTFTYGLRWEVNPPPTGVDGRDALAVNQFDDPARLTAAPEGARLWKTTYGNFAPRVGLAYQLSDAHGRETVVRAGFGLFYDLGSAAAGNAFADSFPFVMGRAAFNTPFALAPAVSSPAGPSGVPFYAFDPHLRLPYSLKWSLSVERALGGDQTLSASYAGAAGRRLLLTESLLGRNASFEFLRLTTNGASSDYHSLQVQFNRRLAQGLHALVSYTWSKSLDDFSEDSAAGALLRATESRLERGPSDFDARHVLAGFVTYEIPAPFGGGLGNSLLRNWAVSSVFNARSALPVNVLYGVPTAYGLAYLRPDQLEGVPLYIEDQSVAGGRRINASAFSLPGSFRQGTLGRNSLRGFPLFEADAALNRWFRLREGWRLEFRAEAFNLFNRANFEDPSGNGMSLGTRGAVTDTLRPNGSFGQSASLYGRGLWEGAGSFGSFYRAGGPRTFQFALKLEF